MILKFLNERKPRASRLASWSSPLMGSSVLTMENYVNSLEAGDSIDDRFSVAVNIQINFIKSKVKGTLSAVIDSSDPTALKVQMTEEDIRQKYPWNYKTLTSECRKRYEGFKEDATYHKARKAAMTKPQLGIVRLLDPGDPKSSRKPFFNPNILLEFDRVYTKG